MLSARGRFAACLAASLTAHGALILALPAPEAALLAPQPPLELVLRQPAPEPAKPSAASERRARSVTGRAVPIASPVSVRSSQSALVLPAPKAVPVPAAQESLPSAERLSQQAELPVKTLAEPPIEAAAEPQPMADAPAETLSAWRPQRGTDPTQAAQALLQEAEQWRRDAEFRAMVIGSMWMGMYQRLSAAHPEHEGECLFLRRSGFRPECLAPSLEAWSERLGLQAWAGKLAELDESLQGLRFLASQGRLQLQALRPDESVPSASAAQQPESYDSQR